MLAAGTAIGQTEIAFNSSTNNTTISTCNGFIIDSGGQGGGGYSDGEDVTVTICPGTPGEVISIQFNLFNLSLADDNPSPSQTNVDYMHVYDGASTAANTLGTYSGNQLQGTVIQATALNPSGCITLRFTSNTAGTGAFTASVSCETPCVNPTAGGSIVGGITSDSIRVCLGEPVTFNSNGSSAGPGFTIVSYSWDFMDGSTSNGQTVTHSFNEPGQYRVQLFVTDDNGCQNTNLIDLQVLVATLPDFTGFPGPVELCLGESVAFTATPEEYEVLWNGFSSSERINDGCLPDTLLGVSQEVELLQTGFEAGLVIDNISDIQGFCLDLEHSFMGDLVVILECPNGQTEILHQQGGGGTQLGVPVEQDNVDCSDPETLGEPFTYCFTPTATETWVEWVDNNGFAGTLSAGNYEPIEPLTNLIGCPVNGVWTLRVIDNWASDDGTLFAFSLDLDPSLYPDVQEFEPQIGQAADSSYWTYPAPQATALSANADVITISPTAAGTFNYVYSVRDDFGCLNDTSVTVSVAANPVPDAGPDITLCTEGSVQLNGTISGVGGGSACPFTFNLQDLLGDSWNGNNLLVTVNGVTTTYTVPFSTASFTLNIAHGTPISVQFDGAGSWPDECVYQVIAPNGEIILQDGGNFDPPSTAPQTFTADCFGGYDFMWSPAALVSNPGIPDPIGTFTTGSTTMTLTVMPTGRPLCATTDQLNVFIDPVDPGQDSSVTVCPSGASIDLFPLLGPGVSTSGQWTNPDGALITMPYDPATMGSGAYTYTAGADECAASAVVTVFRAPVITADFTIVPNPVSMFNPSVQLLNASSSDATSFTWTVPDGIPGSSVTENMYTQFPDGVPGVYDVHLYAQNDQGCWDMITRKVRVISEVLLYAPNAFTPDGDEFNQTWRVYIDGVDKTSFNLLLYNRWGETIWESNDPEGEWDGTYNNRIVPEGMYTWTIRVRDIDTDERLEFNGYINVLK